MSTFFDWYQGLGLPHCFTLDEGGNLGAVSLCGRARKSESPRQREHPATEAQIVRACSSCLRARAAAIQRAPSPGGAP